MIQNCELVHKIGNGCFDEIYLCRKYYSRKTAIKKIDLRNEIDVGIPGNILREVSFLKELLHENIVRLLGVQVNDEYLYIVFEYLDIDLHSFITSSKVTMNSPIIKAILRQILLGVEYWHSLQVPHKDVKPENLLIDLDKNIVKLANFGVLRDCRKQKVASSYKAPELLLGFFEYSTPIDMWAVGCTFAEMINGKPLFPCKDVMGQLSLIFGLLGTPTEETWHGVSSVIDFLNLFPQHKPKDLAKEFHDLEPAGVDLLSKMLCLDPKERITAKDALEHEYLKCVSNVSFKTAVEWEYLKGITQDVSLKIHSSPRLTVKSSPFFLDELKNCFAWAKH